jgi:hypothetical protein
MKKSIFLVIGLVALLGVGYYFMKSGNKAQGEEQKLVVEAGSNMVQKIEPVIPQEEKPVEKVCPQNWVKYDSELFSVCHDPKWGKPEVKNEGIQNGLWFPKAEVERDGGYSYSKAPSLGWESKAYLPPDGFDFNITCYTCMDYSKSEEEFLKVFKGIQYKDYYIDYKENQLSAKKVQVNGKNAWRVAADFTGIALGDKIHTQNVSYYIPNATEKFHFSSSGLLTNASELDTFMDTLIFKK